MENPTVDELELKNALMLKEFRGEASKEKAHQTLLNIEADKQAGLLLQAPMDWAEAFYKAGQLAMGKALEIILLSFRF